MRNVALITYRDFPQLYTDDQLLLPELAKRGITGTPVCWDAPDTDWSSFAAIVMRSPWDYFQRPAEFRTWLGARTRGATPLFNSADILQWNFDKRYLEHLQRAGIPIVPTVFARQGQALDLAAVARERGWNEVVIKPTIAGGAYRTHRFAIADSDRYAADIALTLRECDLMVQPFLPEILADGELSFIFFDGTFSHAVRKRARAGDYRVQFTFGGTTEDITPPPELIAQARACLDQAPSLPLYARVDGVVSGGRFVLMELEIFEPMLFLSRHAEAPARFATALAKRLSTA